jgi:hypothetical protein
MSIDETIALVVLAPAGVALVVGVLLAFFSR